MSFQKELEWNVINFDYVEEEWNIWFINPDNKKRYHKLETFHPYLKVCYPKQIRHLVNNYNIEFKQISDDQFGLTIDYIMGDCQIVIVLENEEERLRAENYELKQKIFELEERMDLSVDNLKLNKKGNVQLIQIDLKLKGYTLWKYYHKHSPYDYFNLQTPICNDEQMIDFINFPENQIQLENLGSTGYIDKLYDMLNKIQTFWNVEIYKFNIIVGQSLLRICVKKSCIYKYFNKNGNDGILIIVRENVNSCMRNFPGTTYCINYDYKSL